MIDPNIINEAYEELNESGIIVEEDEKKEDKKDKPELDLKRIKSLAKDLVKLIDNVEDSDVDFNKEDVDLKKEIEKAFNQSITKVISRINDLTVKTRKSDDELEGEFEIYTDKSGEFRFRLRAENGQIIMSSEGYKSKQALKKAIDSVIENTADSDTTEKENKEDDGKDDKPSKDDTSDNGASDSKSDDNSGGKDEENKDDDKDEDEEDAVSKFFPKEEIESPQGNKYKILKYNKDKSLVEDIVTKEKFKIETNILEKWHDQGENNG